MGTASPSRMSSTTDSDVRPRSSALGRSTTRWVSTRGEKGPWSEVAAATVAA